jgi:hypothetical protein
MQMAMYLQQKDVESTVLAWIQAACMCMIDEDCVQAAESSEDKSKAQAVLKEQQDAWEAV